eukprot:2225076-Amphidinium_carterae.1
MPSALQAIQQCLGTVEVGTALDPYVEKYRDALSTFFGLPGFATSNLSGVWFSLVAAWRKYSQDPDDQIETWLEIGAPMGVEKHP